MTSKNIPRLSISVRPEDIDVAIRTPEFGQVVEDTHESSGAAVVTSRELFP
jgi:hypothetical protein